MKLRFTVEKALARGNRAGQGNARSLFDLGNVVALTRLTERRSAASVNLLDETRTRMPFPQRGPDARNPTWIVNCSVRPEERPLPSGRVSKARGSWARALAPTLALGSRATVSFWVYILRCSDDSFYVGHTDELDRRIAQRESGEADGYTCTRRPVHLDYSQEFTSRYEALTAEVQIKGWSRRKKQALIEGDWGEISRLAKRQKPFEEKATRPSRRPQRTRPPQGER
jgi:predicted GIY-YIG superfamily endonuclease